LFLVVIINKQTDLMVADAEGTVCSDGNLNVSNTRLAGLAAVNLVAYGFDGSDASNTATDQVVQSFLIKSKKPPPDWLGLLCFVGTWF
jgi:hypothetical protein